MRYRRLHRPLVHKKRAVFSRTIKEVMKGFAMGISVAGIVNTVAPGAIPSFCGYLVGKGFGNLLLRAGLITFGLFSQPSINAVAVLGISGVFGGILGGFIGVMKGVWRWRKRACRKRRDKRRMLKE